MATLIPALQHCRQMTGGERRFAQRLVDKLEGDYTCWYDIRLGAKSSHPDFIILSPRRGLLVIEVKDWKLEIIQAADRASVTLHTNIGQKIEANPLEQARQYAHVLVNLLEKDAQLTANQNRRYRNSMIGDNLDQTWTDFCYLPRACCRAKVLAAGKGS